MEMGFEWDENKRQANISKHRLDFVAAKEIWEGYVLEVPSNQPERSESRFLAIGEISGITITVIYTWRGENRRLISARKARRYERENYENEARRRAQSRQN